MNPVLFPGEHLHLYRCTVHDGHYHILSRSGAVPRPCWSRLALIDLIRELRLTLPNTMSEERFLDAQADLAAILSQVNAFARKRNRAGGKFAPGFVLPHDWQPGEHEVAGPWQRFRQGETAAMCFPANDACGGIVVPLFCDFVGRDFVPEPGRSFREPEWAAYAESPARVIGQDALGIEWKVPETED